MALTEQGLETRPCSVSGVGALGKTVAHCSGKIALGDQRCSIAGTPGLIFKAVFAFG
jgi:hypothetical protein